MKMCQLSLKCFCHHQIVCFTGPAEQKYIFVSPVRKSCRPKFIQPEPSAARKLQILRNQKGSFSKVTVS